MEQEKIEYFKLSKENIGSFEDFLPTDLIVRIANEGMYGYGVAVDDYASGVVMGVKNVETNELWIHWLYVDEECRGLGIGDALYEKMREGAEGVSAVCVKYLFPIHEQMEEFLLHKGFSIYSKEDDLKADENEVHIARLGEGDERELTDDQWLMENEPDAGLIMPRLIALKGLMDDMELDCEIVVPRGAMPGICILRGQELPPVDVFVLTQEDNPEDYAVSLRIVLDVGEDEMDSARSLIREWENRFEITSAVLHPDDETIDFIATMPVEKDQDLESFGEFYKAFITETDSCLEGL